MNDEKNEVIDNSNENSNIEELNVSNNNELDSENQENVMGNDDNTKKEKKGGRKLLIFIIIILLIALCVGGYFLYKIYIFYNLKMQKRIKYIVHYQ